MIRITQLKLPVYHSREDLRKKIAKSLRCTPDSFSYEIIRLAGRSDNLLIRASSAPGMWLQRLTTREPDDSMIEVAIACVEAVFDWKAYLTENFGYAADAWEDQDDVRPDL